MSALRTREVDIVRGYRGHNEPVHSPDKASLRQQLAARRQALSDDQIEAARGAIRAAVLQVCGRSTWRRIAAYVPLKSEPGSLELLAELASRGVEVLVPIVRTDHDLEWTVWDQNGTHPPLGVEAVATADAVLVPALSVALDGTRLGRGGGSYDRALARVSGVPIAALVYSDELVGRLPSDEWDQRVTAAVTPEGWRELPPSM
jgi:5-formyltetrahydrofolate cyclo-ligase